MRGDYFEEQAEQRELDSNRYNILVELTDEEMRKIAIEKYSFKIKIAERNLSNTVKEKDMITASLLRNIKNIEENRENFDIEKDYEIALSQNSELDEYFEMAQDWFFVESYKKKKKEIGEGSIQSKIKRNYFYLDNCTKRIKKYKLEIENYQTLLNAITIEEVEATTSKRKEVA